MQKLSDMAGAPADDLVELYIATLFKTNRSPGVFVSHIYRFLCLYLVMTSQTIMAISLNPKTCSEKTSLANLIECIASNNLKVMKDASELSQKIIAIDIANQYPNPHLEWELTHDTNQIKENQYLTLKYLQTFDVGHKMEARAEKARTARTLAELKYRLSIKNEIRELIIGIFEIMKHTKEIRVLKKIINSLSSLEDGKNATASQTIKQNLSQESFSLSLQTWKLKLLMAKNRKSTLISKYLGYGIERNKLIALIPEKWPDWPSKIDISGSLQDSLLSQIEQSQNLLLEKNLKVIQSESYRDIHIGPLFSMKKSQTAGFGFGISMAVTLPFFHRDEGQISSAKEKIFWHQHISERLVQQEQENYNQLAYHYQQMHQLQTQLSQEDLVTNRKFINKLFALGHEHPALVLDLFERYYSFNSDYQQLNLNILKNLLELTIFQNGDLLSLIR